MGVVEALVVSIVVAVALAGTAIGLMFAQSPEGADMAPANLESFKVTSANEGMAVPFIFGKVRLPGNLLYYGRLATVEQTEDVGGFDEEEVTTGFDYYMDVWQAICQGPGVVIDEVYVEDRKLDSLGDLGTYEFNDGSLAAAPTRPIDEATGDPLPYVNKLNPIAWIYIQQWYLGRNAQRVPTAHFVVHRDTTTGLTDETLANGANGAAVIWEVLEQAGAQYGDFDFASFDAAATAWSAKGYGMNIAHSRIRKARDMIRDIFNYMEGCLYVDENDQFVLKAFTDSDTSSAAMADADYIRFKFQRKTYEDCFTDFRGTFSDYEQDYTERVVAVRNPQVRALLRKTKLKTVDLTAFRDKETASKRLWEIMKRWSYPWSQIEVTTDLSYWGLNPGDICTVSNSEFSLSSAEFRVLRKDISAVDKNELTFVMRQRLAGLFDDNYLVGGGSGGTVPDYTPSPATYESIFELPYNRVTGEEPAYLMLLDRSSLEIGFTAMTSATGSDYSSAGQYDTFSLRVTLREQYPSGTDLVDDETGILVQVMDVLTPSQFYLTDIAREELFTFSRCIIIGSEMIAYQTATVEGDYYRLKGCIRGMLNTPIGTHSNGSAGWLTRIRNNILEGVTMDQFWVRMVPYSPRQSVVPSDVTPIYVTSQHKAQTPWPPTRIKAVRSGSDIAVQCWATTQLNRGGGWYDGSAEYDAWPPDFEGELVWWTSYDATENVNTDGDWGISYASSFTLYVRHRRSGRVSSTKTLVVALSDGTYIV